MFKSSVLRHGLLALLLTTVTVPAIAGPGPGPNNPHHGPKQPVPPARYYSHSSLPEAASLLLISGITYALIDGLYYQDKGDRYVYVDNPPALPPQTVSSSGVGRIVTALPSGAKTVTVDGATYYVANGYWYAPIASSHKFVIVDPQL